MPCERSPRRFRRRGFPSIAVTAIACAAALPLLCGGLAARAAGDTADVAAGRSLAEHWCAECHQVSGRPTTALDQKAPAFYSVANQPSATAMSLKAFLSTPHPNMPNVRLSQTDLNDLVDYILSLKAR